MSTAATTPATRAVEVDAALEGSSMNSLRASGIEDHHVRRTSGAPITHVPFAVGLAIGDALRDLGVGEAGRQRGGHRP
jgi:hypothetical protein